MHLLDLRDGDVAGLLMPVVTGVLDSTGKIVLHLQVILDAVLGLLLELLIKLSNFIGV